MPQRRALLVFTATLLLGISIGVIGSSFYFRSRVANLLGAGPAGVRKVIMHRLTERLDLDNRQRAAVEASVKRAQRRIAQLRTDHRPELEAVLRESMEELRPVLNSGQVRRLEQLQARFLSRAFQTEPEAPLGATAP